MYVPYVPMHFPVQRPFALKLSKYCEEKRTKIKQNELSYNIAPFDFKLINNCYVRTLLY